MHLIHLMSTPSSSQVFLPAPSRHVSLVHERSHAKATLTKAWPKGGDPGAAGHWLCAGSRPRRPYIRVVGLIVLPSGPQSTSHTGLASRVLWQNSPGTNVCREALLEGVVSRSVLLNSVFEASVQNMPRRKQLRSFYFCRSCHYV